MVRVRPDITVGTRFPDHELTDHNRRRRKLSEIYNGYWYWGRPSVHDLREDLRKLFEKIRPDWDISDPGLKKAWARGETERFYPYRTPEARAIAS
jgi:hypothetical protein